MMLYSFKSARLFFSKLGNKNYFNAPVDNVYTSLIRPLFITTVVNFII